MADNKEILLKIKLEVEKAEKTYKGLADNLNKFKKQALEAGTTLLELEKSNKKGTKTWVQTNKVYKESIKEITSLNEEIKKLTPTFNSTKGKGESFANGLVESFINIKSAFKTGGFSSAIGEASKSMSSLFNIKGKGWAAVAEISIKVLIDAAKRIREFSKAQTELALALGNSKKEIKELTDLTHKLGVTSKFSSIEVTKAATELAKLGYTQKEIQESLEGLVKGATVWGTDVVTTSKLVSSALKAFSLEAKDTERVVSVLASATDASSLNFTTLQGELDKIGTVAQESNVSFEKTVAILTVLTNSGMSASDAGGALKSMFTHLQSKGLTLDDALRQLNSSQDKVTTAQALFGKEGAGVALMLSQQQERIEGVTNAFTDQQGALDLLVKEKMNNFEDATTRVNKAWDGFLLSIEKGDGKLAKFFTSIVNGTADVLELITPTNEYSDALKAQQTEMNLLVAEYMALSGREEDRALILEKIRTNYPELLSYLELEKMTNQELAEVMGWVNEQKEKGIEIAKLEEDKEKINQGLTEKRKELIDIETEARNKLLEISRKHKDIEINFDNKNIIEEFKKVADVVNRTTINFENLTIKADRLGSKYKDAEKALVGYGKSLSEVNEKQKKATQEIIDNEKTLLSKNMTLDKATTVLKKYEDGNASLGQAYQELTGQQNASTEELLAFEEMVKNLSDNTLQSFISTMATTTHTNNNHRISLSGLDTTYADVISAKQNYLNLFPKELHGNQELEATIKGLTAAQFKERTGLVQRLQALNQNISTNFLMTKSLAELSAELAKAEEKAKGEGEKDAPKQYSGGGGRASSGPTKEDKERERERKEEEKKKSYEKLAKMQLEQQKEIAETSISIMKQGLADEIEAGKIKLENAKVLTKAIVKEEEERQNQIAEKKKAILAGEEKLERKAIEEKYNIIEKEKTNRENEIENNVNLTKAEKEEQLAILQDYFKEQGKLYASKVEEVDKKYSNKKIELEKETLSAIEKVNKDYNNQLEEATKTRKLEEFQQRLNELEAQGYSEFAIKQAQLDFENANNAERKAIERELEELEYVEGQDIQAGRDKVEVERLRALLARKANLDYKYNQSVLDLEVQKEKAKFEAYKKVANGIIQILGEETVAGKAAAIAMTTIDTISSIMGTLKAFSGVPVPGYAIAQAVLTGAFGAAQVAKIAGVDMGSIPEGIANVKDGVASAVKLSKGFSIGGYTGHGTMEEVAGLVHKGEVVFSQKDISMLGGAQIVDAMRPTSSSFSGINPVNTTSVQQSLAQGINLEVLAASVKQGAYEGALNGTHAGSQLGIAEMYNLNQIARGAGF